jgi:hypothetical protein
MANNSQQSSNGRSAPLPISALPLPVPDEQPEQPAHTLPTNSEGKLSPAQRARLGLDPYGDDMPAAEPAAPPAPSPTNGNGNGAAPAPPAAQPTEFGFGEMTPFEEAEPQLAEPRLQAVQSTPVFKPVGRTNVSIRQPGDQDDHVSDADRDAAKRKKAKAAAKAANDPIAAIERDRNVLTYGVSWTIFAFLVTALIGFFTTLNASAGSAPGPGPLIPGLISIVLGWVVVFAARGMGKNWVWLMIIPAAVLFIGPYIYSVYWATSVDDSARNYLSATGANALIDVDQTSIVSETVNTSRGCFAITRKRDNLDTEVSVVTLTPSTARQQADFALAPRYAQRIPAGGTRVTQRVFTFKKGETPAIVSDLTAAPLDCANAVAP